jgi:hypothetical protein
MVAFPHGGMMLFHDAACACARGKASVVLAFPHGGMMFEMHLCLCKRER